MMNKTDDPRKVYLMPLLSGLFGDSTGGVPYREQQMISLQYETERKQVSSILPPCYEATDKPVITASFMYQNGLDFMAGRGYNIGTVMVSARFKGEEDKVEGNFVIVMYEDDTQPIILGREQLGIPKLYGDISPVKSMADGSIRSEVSVWGHFLFGIEVKPDNKQPEKIVNEMNKQPRGPPLLGYKYIHAVDGPPDTSYPVAIPSDASYKQVWTGSQGRIIFGAAMEEDVGFNKRIVEVIKSLKVKNVIRVSRIFRSVLLRQDLAKRLK
jgi:acetoacetate decarboxylase